MIEAHIHWILGVTGLVTAAMLGQFFAPRAALRVLNGFDVKDERELFFARIAGLAIGSIGILLCWAAFEPALRTAVVTVAILGKLGFVATVALRPDSANSGFVSGAIFDAAVVALYAGFLLGV